MKAVDLLRAAKLVEIHRQLDRAAAHLARGSGQNLVQVQFSIGALTMGLVSLPNERVRAWIEAERAHIAGELRRAGVDGLGGQDEEMPP